MTARCGHQRGRAQYFPELLLPGNVRELRNTLEHAVVVCESGLVETRHLPPVLARACARGERSDAVHLGVGTTIGEAEKLLILKTLQSTNNNKTRAAEILGISLKTLHNKLKEYGRPQMRSRLRRSKGAGFKVSTFQSF